MKQTKKKWERKLLRRKTGQIYLWLGPSEKIGETADNNDSFECSALSSVSTSSKLYASGISNYWMSELEETDIFKTYYHTPWPLVQDDFAVLSN